MAIIAYIATVIFAITSLATNDVYYLILAIIATIVGILAGKD